MELHSLGGYRLLEPVPTLSSISRLFLARRDDAPEDAPASALAKVLLPGNGDAFAMLKAQFAHEANLLRSFSHPGIPSLRAAGTQNGVDFFVMDYVPGVDLAVLLGHEQNEPRALSKELAVYILGQLADALRYVHSFEVPIDDDSAAEQGEGASAAVEDDDDDDDDDAVDDEGFEFLDVLHRDLCPANVFLSLDGDVVLGDFGSASSKWLAPELTGSDAGHIAYKAPERVTGSGKATVKSDLFSLAVMLWEMLRGERCFKAASELETMDEIVRFDISHSSRRVTGLSSKLSEVLRRNLDRDPERRYPDAYKVLQRLSQAPEAAGAERARQELARLVAEAARERPRVRPDRR
ncbi:MAG TPA: serine/threonine-protein kinase [Enhygromyxa sp.]|nr:serine/threonine-protein kinase [Enhygromyxa sp.]